MINEQLLTIILIAIVVNAALIVAAVVAMRNSRTRNAARTAPEITPMHDAVLAVATAGGGPAGPSPAWIAGRMDAAERSQGGPGSQSGPVGGGFIPPAADDAEVDDDAPLAAAAPTDQLHGLESPAAWRRAVDDEVVRLVRYHRPATVMLVELDGFQRLTERLGESAGERLVRATAGTIRAQARAADRCGLLGRGRFAILLPETDDIQAINFGERVRAECDRWLEAGEVALRVAIGWASLDGNEGAAAAIQEAEHRLDAERHHRA